MSKSRLRPNEFALNIHLSFLMNTQVVEDAPLAATTSADYENPFRKETLKVSENALRRNLEHLERIRADQKPN